ncbi:hypothetical protein D2V05_01595 [Flagellimonas pelagia]|uniref:Uncharacterized protein n=1 Tax=Flagellimonas pelagia TaxID=2306998 RepID=A0A3A1NR40_9FLAO|nr:hypothetical protein D2V05_01595 [Allomuricauda maritima]
MDGLQQQVPIIIGQTQKASYSFSLVSAERQTQQQHNPTARMAVDQMFNDPYLLRVRQFL